MYSTRGVATGVSYTDQNAQFFAFDVLTVISGLAAAFLVGGAFTRVLWPLGLTHRRLVPRVARHRAALPGGDPALHGRCRTSSPRKSATSRNNIAMTRLAYGLGRLGAIDRSAGDEPLTQALIDAEADTFRNARLWDYRPLRTTLDQLQTVRRYYDFTDVDTDRYIIDGVQRQVMLSGRELALEQNPSATGWVNQRIIYTHGIGVAMVPGQRGRQRGPAAALHRQPAAGVDRRGPGDHRAADLLRRAAVATTSSSGPGRPSSTTRPARATTGGRPATDDALDGHDRRSGSTTR